MKEEIAAGNMDIQQRGSGYSTQISMAGVFILNKNEIRLLDLGFFCSHHYAIE